MGTERIGAHLPWARIEEFLPKILDMGLVPEVAFKGPDLDHLESAQIDWAATQLAHRNCRPTVHAPFFDLNPGALDPLVREITKRRLGQALSAAHQLKAHLMVVHPGYDRWRYPGLATVWVSHAHAFFKEFAVRAALADCRLALENIYEQTPKTLVDLVELVGSPWFGHCFDAGHWHLFASTSMADWLDALGDRLFHLHLHDNHGQSDDHLPIGCGQIDFTALLAKTMRLSQPPSMTLEAHSPGHLVQSLEQFRLRLAASAL